MAVRQIIVYTDDVTGERVSEVTTETVCVAGIAYGVDMGPETHKAYAKAVAPYTSAGKRIGRVGEKMLPAGLASQKRPGSNTEQNKGIRDWWARYGEAAALPMPVSTQGRIPATVLAAFQEHQGGPPPAKPEERKPTALGANVRVTGAGRKAPQKAATRSRRSSKAS